MRAVLLIVLLQLLCVSFIQGNPVPDHIGHSSSHEHSHHEPTENLEEHHLTPHESNEDSKSEHMTAHEETENHHPGTGHIEEIQHEDETEGDSHHIDPTPVSGDAHDVVAPVAHDLIHANEHVEDTEEEYVADESEAEEDTVHDEGDVLKRETTPEEESSEDEPANLHLAVVDHEAPHSLGDGHEHESTGVQKECTEQHPVIEPSYSQVHHQNAEHPTSGSH